MVDKLAVSVDERAIRAFVRVKKEVEDLKAKMLNVEDVISSSKTNLKTVSKKEFNDLDRKVIQFEKRLLVFINDTNDAKSLIKDFKEAQKTVEEYEVVLRNLEDRIQEDLAMEVAHLKKNESEHKQELNTLNSELRDLKRQLTFKDAQIEEVRLELREFKSLLRRLGPEVLKEELDNQKEYFNRRFNSLHEEFVKHKNSPMHDKRNTSITETKNSKKKVIKKEDEKYSRIGELANEEDDSNKRSFAKWFFKGDDDLDEVKEVIEDGKDN